MIDILLSTTSLLLVVLLSDFPNVLFFALIILLVILHKIQPHSLMFYLVCGIGGALAESFAVKYGKNTWKYSEPTEPLNIPIWLIPLWAIAGIFISRVSQILQ